MEERPARAWHVFATYLAAVAAIFLTSAAALDMLGAVYPDVPETVLVGSLPGLLAGSLAASAALLLTLLLLVRPLDPARFRLLPGWETGPTLLVAVLGLLALGQALDSMTVLARVEEPGALEVIRRVLASTRGPDLFGAVVVLGVVAGGAEEIFFRGYMQSRLREHWRPPTAVLATAAAFGALHLPLSSLHMLLAFALGLYLGFVAEVTGSALPCIVCHVVNNAVYTLQTALGVNVVGHEANLVAVAVSAAVFLVCVLWIRRAAEARVTG